MLIWYRLTAWLRGRGRLREVWLDSPPGPANPGTGGGWSVNGVPMPRRAYMALRHGVGVSENE